jgi:hypothetical protein
MSVVIDTNVPIVANGHHEEASLRCIEACIDALMQARSGPVLVDDGYLIFEEYRRHLLQAGQPGLGDAFFRWLWDNQANPACCRQITIVPDQLGYRVFEEFPDDPELAGFDRSDRKFVAVALASEESPPILNASDTDWWEARDALARHGVYPLFLCPELMTQ